MAPLNGVFVQTVTAQPKRLWGKGETVRVYEMQYQSYEAVCL